MKNNPFLTIIPQLQEEYGLTVSEDTAISIGMIAYNKIGNSNVRLKAIKAHPEKTIEGNWKVCLPCDVLEIEAVTLDFELGQEVSATDNYLAYKTANIENWIERFKRNKDEYYLSGAFVKYVEAGGALYFNEPYGVVNILYKAEINDPETGLPFLSDRELNAICAYIAYTTDLKKARLTKDQNLLQFATLEKQNWLQLCSHARVAESYSQNEINEVLDILTSFDVHKHNVSSTKPIK